MKSSSLLARKVRIRAGGRCEYCQIHSDDDGWPFEIDHIIPTVHDGSSRLENLAFSCWHCNSHKSVNVAGINLETLEVTRLLHPRRDKWNDHFQWDGPILIGITSIGSTTVNVLKMNDWLRMELRSELIRRGRFPPILRISI